MQRARARGSELTLVSFLHTAGCSPRCSGGFQARSAQGAAVQFSVIYSLCRIESNASFPQLTSPHKNPTSVGVSAIPALFSALSSIISEHRPAWHLSILRESVSAACFLCCVPSPLRAFSAACYSSRCVLPLYLAACILHPSPHLQSPSPSLRPSR